MKAKPVVVRPIAHRETSEAVRYYASEAGPDVARQFVQALDETYSNISASPAIGSPRYGHELNLPGLRSRKLRRFPYIVFYIELEDHVDVWRILHSARDIPAWLASED